MHINVHTNLKGQMKSVAGMTMQAVRRKLNSGDRLFCFEILGFDFIVDEQFQVWLIEVNTNPCLRQSSPLLQTLLPRMLDDALRLTVDQVFPRRTALDASPHHVPGYSSSENMWEYLIQLACGRPPTSK